LLLRACSAYNIGGVSKASVGPTFVLPSGTDKVLTQGKYSIGPTFVALMIEGPWVVGALVNNVWSFTGKSSRPDVN